jgi:GT2 family glycosyltransferase
VVRGVLIVSETSKEKQPRVSIIILNWSGLKDTEECLESLQRITYLNYEVIVVDNASKGDDVKVLRERFGEYIHIIENDENYGFAEGNNIGIRQALKSCAGHILLLNNDTIVAPEFLSELVNAAESDRKIGLAGPKIYFYDEPNKIWFAGGKISLFSASSNRGRGLVDKGQFDKVDYVDFVSGSCMLIKRSVLESAGLLDPVYFFGIEDVDMSLRATQAGFSNVFVSASKIWHKGFSSGIKRPDIPYYTSRNAIILARKHYRVFRKAVIRAVFAVSMELLIASIRFRSASTFVMMIRGFRDGLTIDLKSSRATKLK